jgi:hypothetical protein
VSAAALFFASCKEDTVIKANLAPSVDNVSTEPIPDTITILSKTFFEDTVVTSNESSSQLVFHGLGKANDPFFGLTNAGIYLQVVPEKAYYRFPSVIDSAFLILPYSGFSWGDTSATDAGAKQVYNVYRVTDTMGRDTKYYSNSSKAYDPNPVGTLAVDDVRKLKDSVFVLGRNRTPHLRIRLDGSFISAIVTDAATSGDNSAFLDKFRGLYIAPADMSNSGKAISYFVINGANDYQRAAIQFFYFQDSVRNAFFSFASNAAGHFNKITRTYNQEVKNILNSTAESDEVLLLQNTPGTAIDLKFPYLKNLPQGVINKAELVITKISYSTDPDAGANKFFEPARIFPRGVEPGGTVYDVLDTEGNEASLNFVDGTRREITLPNGIKVTRYVINIPREVQRAIVNKLDVLHLRIYGVQRFFGAYRLTAGGKNSAYKVSLNIAYSKI